MQNEEIIVNKISLDGKKKKKEHLVKIRKQSSVIFDACLHAESEARSKGGLRTVQFCWSVENTSHIIQGKIRPIMYADSLKGILPG